MSFSSASASSGLNTNTRARESSGALSSNDGFSVVAPTRTMVPSSITGKNESCCARLKRWISSTNRSVPCPSSRRRCASSNTLFRSAMPVKIAEICSKCRSVACANSRATVVLPLPGGPQNTRLPSERASSMRVSAPSRPSRWFCPTTSLSFCGRSLSASGRGASLSRPAAAGDALVVYCDDYVAALEGEIASIGPVVHVDDDHALVGTPDLQLVSERGRQVGNPGAGKRRTRANRDLVARCRRCRLQRDLQGHFAAGAQHGERCRAADWFGGKAVVEGVDVVDRLRVDRGDDIAGLQSTAFRRTAFGDAGDQRADWTL